MITRCFTLIETILVVALVGLLLTLSVSHLALVRDRARTSVNLSNLRQHAAILSVYTSDYAGAFPQLAEPVATFSVIRCESAGIAALLPYFHQTRYWNVGLADGYYNGAWSARFFQSPWVRESRMETSYEMACTMIADPRFFHYDTRVEFPTQLRTVRLSEVLFPAHKSLLVARESVDSRNPASGVYTAHQRASSDVGFVDGHAASPAPGQAIRQMYNLDGPFSQQLGGHAGYGLPMTHTTDGVRGRDVR